MQKTRPNPDFVRALLIALAGFWVFAPALQGDWLMDDDLYVTQNILLHDPARLFKIWFAPGSLIEYYPIEATVQAVQWHFWHLNPLGYHLTNVLLHILSGLLVWRLLAKFDLRFAWLGGFLFVVHPANVESVAWISELKNTLSLPPFLLAMCAWIDFEDRGRARDYLLALGFFLFAMLCKISMALFPLVILLFAWWKRGRIGARDVRHAAPFFLISLVLGATTVLVGNWFRAGHLQSAAPPDIGDWPARIALPGLTIAFYFTQFVWPVGLSPIYPRWPINPPSPVQFLPWPVLAGVIAWLWSRRAGWGRHALLGFGFFLINLLPFAGFTSVTYMSFTWVMDHLLYLPMIGLIGLAMAGIEWLDARAPAALRLMGTAAFASLLGLLMLGSHEYAGVFSGPEKLWTYTLRHNPDSWLAHNNLANVYFETGRMPEAVAEYQQALRDNPRMVEANTNLGFALQQLGHTDEAITHYREALEYNPHFFLALEHLGEALAAEGRPQEAAVYFREALQVDPGDADVRARLQTLGTAGTAP